MQLGLRVETLTSAEIRRAIEVNRAHARLSAPDTFAFVIAQARGWCLLTGDGVLRELATTESSICMACFRCSISSPMAVTWSSRICMRA